MSLRRLRNAPDIRQSRRDEGLEGEVEYQCQYSGALDVSVSSRHSALSRAGSARHSQKARSVAAIVLLGATVLVPSTAEASNIDNARAKALILYRQIQSIGSRVEALGQKYDLAQINLRRLNNKIKRSKAITLQIEQSVANQTVQLRKDALFAYVTNAARVGGNPLFTHDVLKSDATNVYNELATGDVTATLARLSNDRIRLGQVRRALQIQERHAVSTTRLAAGSFHEANVLRATLERTLGHVKGLIANFIASQEAAAAAVSAAVLREAKPVQGVPAPPSNSLADVAIRTALSLIGVPYVWGGASRRGVDCSGLVLVAYAAAGVFLPHYSGSQYADTVRVPLWNIEPGDLLFYGPNGSEHEAMYIGDGKMIEASSTGTLVHISPVRFGYGFVGLGRVRT